MRNILAIFRGDLHRLRRNLVAWAIILGLAVVPCLYSWFNINACWDPYGKTGELKIAIANSDEGYTGELIEVPVNFGGNLVSEVSATDKFDWIITDEEDAIDGTKSGKYYAAVVIPESFSEDMMSIFSDKIKHPEMVYYSNEKENAIATKITTKGATAIQQQVSNAFTSSIVTLSTGIVKSLIDSDDPDKRTEALTGLASNVRMLKSSVLLAGSSVTALKSSISSIDDMLKTSSELASGSAEVTSQSRELIGLTDAEIKAMITEIDNNIKVADDLLKELQQLGVPGLEDLIAKVEAYRADLQTLKDNLNALGESSNETLDAVDDVAENLSIIAAREQKSLSKLKKALKNTSSNLKDTASKLENIAADLDEAAKTGNTDNLEKMFSVDAADLGEFVASPVQLNKIQIYHVKNYGSSMAPFYTSLAIWVGGIILVALLSAPLESSRRREFEKLRDYQAYFGRYMIFFFMGIIQSLLICIGDIYFLGIQCIHPMLFILAGVFASIVFGNMIYTLTVSFGDIGKAVCVVLMVIQVAGSGGTFPIEMTPTLFQKLYPLLPFNYSMSAMRETIAGTYGNTYMHSMMMLSLYLIGSLILGLLLRKPIIKMNRAFHHKLDETGLM